MDLEQNTICEKIVNEIDAVFHKDPDLCSFDIIHLPSNQNKNKSPVIHEENNLGLESWCVQHVYEYAHKTILTVPNKQDFTKQTQCTQHLLKYLNSAILINPDVSTFWNIRRKLFVKNRLNITKEFQFSSIVLSKKPKSNEAFFYRRWLFSFQSGESIDWTFELGLCERCADKSASNYHAWCHRQWVLQKAPYLLKYEVRLTEKFIRKHIGDYSGYNHRQHIICKLLETGYYEEHESITNYPSLCDYITTLMSVTVNTATDLVNVLMPNCDNANIGKNKLQTLLYCLNIAAYDLQLCAELKNMYGYREAFNSHRKAVLKFFVDNCAVFNVTKKDEPQMKMLKVDRQNNRTEFLDAVRVSEGNFGELHRKWCQIFLGFDYSDIDIDNVDRA